MSKHEHYPYLSAKDENGKVFAHVCDCGKPWLIEEEDKEEEKKEEEWPIITLKYPCGCEYDYTTGGIILDEDPGMGDNIRLCNEHGRLIPFAKTKDNVNETK